MGLPPRLTSFCINISSQISLNFLKFPLKFSISSHPGWQDGTINVTLFYTFTIYIQFLVGFIAMCSRFYRDMFVQMDSWVDLSIEEVAKKLSLCFLKTFIRRPRFFIILFKTTFSRWPRWRRRVWRCCPSTWRKRTRGTSPAWCELSCISIFCLSGNSQ